MPVRIRLQRHGKKGKPFYWIVAADSRSKRDGKFLEKLGIYNPNTNPATIEVKVDNAVEWLQNGAQPSHTAKRILSYKGVLLKHHLLGGVAKGALTEEDAQKKFEAWVKDKELAVASKAKTLDQAKEKAREEALKAEKEVSDKRALAAVEAETEVAKEGTEGADAVAEGTEAPAEVAESKEETPAEETLAEETKTEEPQAEAPAEEAPAEEVAEAAAEEAKAETAEAPSEKAKAEVAEEATADSSEEE